MSYPFFSSVTLATSPWRAGLALATAPVLLRTFFIAVKLQRRILFVSSFAQFKQLETRPVSVPDFVNFRVLGRGGFGSVNGQRLLWLLACPLHALDCERFWCAVQVAASGTRANCTR